MNIEEFRDYCLNKPGVTESCPFGDQTLVFKVMNKIFALVGIDNFDFTNLKCEPERAIKLRERYHAVKLGYHMNKKHWNSIYFNRDASDRQILDWVDHSYNLIIESLSKKAKAELIKLSDV